MSASEPVLPTDSEERKQIPLFSGVLNYFPLALAAVARVSKRGNDKHNPGQPLHWARGKSGDHLDCVARHLLDAETVNAAGEYEDLEALVWRGLAALQEREERRLGKSISRGSVDERPTEAAQPPLTVRKTFAIDALRQEAHLPAWQPKRFKTGETCEDPSCLDPSHYAESWTHPSQP